MGLFAWGMRKIEAVREENRRIEQERVAKKQMEEELDTKVALFHKEYPIRTVCEEIGVESGERRVGTTLTLPYYNSTMKCDATVIYEGRTYSETAYSTAQADTRGDAINIALDESRKRAKRKVYQSIFNAV